jgi:hypothetical protein
MAGPPPEGNGFNFAVSWGFVEWALTAIVTAGSGVAFWVFGLGKEVDRLRGDVTRLQTGNEQLELRALKHQTDIDLLRKDMDDKYLEVSVSREKLKGEILERIAALPTQVFIAEALNRQTARIDQLLDLKVRHD